MAEPGLVGAQATRAKIAQTQSTTRLGRDGAKAHSLQRPPHTDGRLTHPCWSYLESVPRGKVGPPTCNRETRPDEGLAPVATRLSVLPTILWVETPEIQLLNKHLLQLKATRASQDLLELRIPRVVVTASTVVVNSREF